MVNFKDGSKDIFKDDLNDYTPDFDDENNNNDNDDKGRSPLIYIIAVFMLLLLVVMIFPSYSVKIDPRPSYIPSVDEVFLFFDNHSLETVNISSRNDFLKVMIPENPVVKITANRIVSSGCSGEMVCNAKILYYFVRDNFVYVPDPVNFEYVEMPQDFIISGGGDCESGTLLLANLMESVGINSQLVFVPGHAFLRIWVPSASKKYKFDDGWIYLDWTCNNCKFGELADSYEYMTFLDI